MTKDLQSILETILIPKIIEKIVETEKVSEVDAIDCFYHSQTYKLLTNEATGIWHFSPLLICEMYKTEVLTGEPVFPVEG